MAKVKKAELIESIERNFGVLTLVAREFDVDRKTIKRNIVKWNLVDHRDSQREKLKDHGEKNIVHAMIGTNTGKADSLFLQMIYERLITMHGEKRDSDHMKLLKALITKVRLYSDQKEKLETSKWFLERQAIERGYGNVQKNINIPKDHDERTDEEIDAEIQRLQDLERMEAERKLDDGVGQ
jgi:hypothetical protein